MVWALPPIAVTGEVIQASWANNTRASLNETAAAKAATSGRVFQATGTNALKEVGGMVLIEEDHLAANGVINFQSIPSDYRHLGMIARLRSDRAAGSDTFDITLNSDTGNNYDKQLLRSNTNNASRAEAFAQNSLEIAVVLDTADADLFDYVKIEIPDYADGGTDKIMVVTYAGKYGTASSNSEMRMLAGFWRNVAAITRIDLIPVVGTEWVAESVASLYGLSV